MKAIVDSQPAGHLPAPRMRAGGLAALTLMAANAGMLFIYFAFDLTLFQVVLVYWWEALWIGLYGGLKLLTASLFGAPYKNDWVEVSRGSSLLLSLTVIAKSGLGFVTLLSITGYALVLANEALTGVSAGDLAFDQLELIIKCSLLFLVGHGISFVVNFLLHGEFRNAHVSTLVWLPFRRCIGLLVTSVAGLLLIIAYPALFSQDKFAVLLIACKLAWDILLHRRERQSLESTQTSRKLRQ